MTSAAARQPGPVARDATAIAHGLLHGLAWLWRSYVIVITAIAHHQVPPSAQTAAFAATFAAVLLFVFRSRRHTDG